MSELYSETPECLIVLFSSGYRGTEERLQREQEAWYGSARIERLAEGHSALIIRPGCAMRLVS